MATSSLQAAVVAKMRNNLSEMKTLLASKLNGQDLATDPDASDDEAERARQLFLEVCGQTRHPTAKR